MMIKLIAAGFVTASSGFMAVGPAALAEACCKLQVCCGIMGCC